MRPTPDHPWVDEQKRRGRALAPRLFAPLTKYESKPDPKESKFSFVKIFEGLSKEAIEHLKELIRERSLRIPSDPPLAKGGVIRSHALYPGELGGPEGIMPMSPTTKAIVDEELKRPPLQIHVQRPESVARLGPVADAFPGIPRSLQQKECEFRYEEESCTGTPKVVPNFALPRAEEYRVERYGLGARTRTYGTATVTGLLVEALKRTIKEGGKVLMDGHHVRITSMEECHDRRFSHDVSATVHFEVITGG